MTSAAGNKGFTAIELALVIGVMAILTTMAVPSIAPILRRSRLQRAAAEIQNLHAQARALARAQADQGIIFGIDKGVTVEDGATVNYCAITRNGTPIDGRGWVTFPPSLAVDGPTSWYYQPRTGYPTTSSSGTGMASISLLVRQIDDTANGRQRAAIAIYQIGVAHAIISP